MSDEKPVILIEPSTSSGDGDQTSSASSGDGDQTPSTSSVAGDQTPSTSSVAGDQTPSTSSVAGDQTPSTSGSGDGAGVSSETVIKLTPIPSSDVGYIRLRVITSEANNEVQFRVKPYTSLGRLKRSYCSKLGVQLEGLRFMFEGHRITDEDTPKSLEMTDDDVIEIYQERTGGNLMKFM